MVSVTITMLLCICHCIAGSNISLEFNEKDLAEYFMSIAEQR